MTASPVNFKLRHVTEGSLSHTTESSSSSYGLIFRFQLLPTLPHGNAVTFSYRAMAFPDTDFHHAN